MLRGKKYRLWFSMILLLLGACVVGASLGEMVHAAPEKNQAQDNIVISEFRARGPSAGHEASDDFVEILTHQVLP